MDKKAQRGFTVSEMGSIWLFTPLDDEASKFLVEEVEAQPWQFLGPSLAVDKRPAIPLLRFILDRGFEVEAA